MPGAVLRLRSSVLPSAVAVLTLAVGGCASGAGQDDSSPRSSTRIYGVMDRQVGSDEMELVNDASVVEGELDFAPDRVWPALLEVYDELGIPLTGADADQRILETREVRVSRIGRRRMSRWVDCGSTFTGPLADSYDVHLTLTTQVVEQGVSGSRIRQVANAWARPRTRSGSQVHCTSRGLLLPRIVEELEAHLAGEDAPGG